MKATLNTAALKSAMSLCGKLTGRSPIALLNCVKIEPTEGGAIVTSCSGEAWFSYFVAGECDGGAVCVDSGTFAKRVSLCKDDSVNIETSSEMVMKWPGATHKLMIANADDFPVPPELGWTQIEVDCAALFNAVDEVSAGRDDNPHGGVLNGTKIEGDGKSAVAVALDTHHVLKVDIGKCKAKFDMVLPSSLSDFVSGQSGESSLSESDHWIKASIGHATMTGTKYQMAYPKYERVIPVDCGTVAVADVAAFKDALAQCAPAASDNANRVYIFGVEGGFYVTALSETYGTAVAFVDAEGWATVELALNYRFAQDFLAIVEPGEFEFQWNASARPMNFVQGPRHCTIMPMAMNHGRKDFGL